MLSKNVLHRSCVAAASAAAAAASGATAAGALHPACLQAVMPSPSDFRKAFELGFGEQLGADFVIASSSVGHDVKVGCLVRMCPAAGSMPFGLCCLTEESTARILF